MPPGGDSKEAMADLEKARELAPQNLQFCYDLARMDVYQGRRRRAIAVLCEAERLPAITSEDLVLSRLCRKMLPPLLRAKTGLDADPTFDAQHDKALWPALKDKLTTLFKSQPRDHWCALMEGTDVCFAPILSMADALTHPHNVERGTFVKVANIDQPAPAPRFLGTPAPTPVGRR